ncbi:MAG: hypothetical protein NC181_04355 [Clostridium sp.]|nr:hypothetical protein [Clostridium sp.]MCM1444529.1 hypothetical protein [Candidatus Amulumruptor caecigallinarius]
MDLLIVLYFILAGEIGVVSIGTSKMILRKNKNIEGYFNDNDFNIEVAPNLNNFTDIEKIDGLEIQNFVAKISKCPHFNKNKLLNDLQSITINGINPILYFLKNQQLGGNFTPTKNHIEYANVSKLKELIINHELLHLSAYFKSEKVTFCGLRQIRDNKEIGVGMDEAMDMHLLKKYFNQSNENAYGVETVLFDRFTKITPLDILEKYYFEMNLLGLINHLENYDDKLNIIKFIRSFDFMFEHGEYAAMFKDRQFNETILFITQCLIKWYALSNYQKTIDNQKDEDKYLNQTAEYIKSLDFHYRLLWKDFAALNNEILNTSIKESDISLGTKTKLLEKVLKKSQ